MSGDKLYQIRKFYEELQEWMEFRTGQLVVLTPGDFKDGVLSNQNRELYRHIEQSLVAMSTSKGESDDAKLQELLQDPRVAALLQT